MKTTSKSTTKTVQSKTLPKDKFLPKLTPVKQALQNHLVFSSFKTSETATPRDWYDVSAYTLRDHVVERWIKTAESYTDNDPKRLYYWSKFWQKLIFRQSFRLNSFGRTFAGGFHTEVFC